MAVSQADVIAFTDAVANLFTPWQSLDSMKMSYSEQSGFWDVKVQPTEIPLPLKASIERAHLRIVGPPTFIEKIGLETRDGWTPVPQLEPESYVAAVALPHGLGGLWSEATATVHNYNQIEVQFPG